MTILEKARAGEVTAEMIVVAEKEGISPELIRQGVAAGEIVILKSTRPNIKPVAVGKGLYTKVSASVGMYEESDTIDGELAKIAAAVKAKTDTLMDLSVRGPIDAMREKVLSTVDRPVGTLPLYQTLAVAQEKYGTALDMTADDMFEIMEKQAAEGVSFLALHCGTTMDVVNRAKEEGRIDPLVSYGGSHLIGWMIHNQCENPFFTQYDRVLEICRKYDVVLSFADGMRPGCIADSLDGAQVQELVILGGLVKKARKAGVQVMVKGPGHVPLDRIQTTVELQKSLCGGAPYFVFGCLPTDSGVGMDHVTGAIGGAIASYYGADFLCYVTPAEHIGMPNVEDVYLGVMASRIAAHAGDIGKGHPNAIAWDEEMSVARRKLDWNRQMELAIDPETATKTWKARSTDFSSECTMCGDFCAMKVIGHYLREENKEARN
ncbi:phosphomethylpyrimidine synthase ThiC [Acetobacterium paludosum]|uniref:Phosphomethylpyrimidine synthase n=1 Tax=Acetobacterium paludosum TaxID=52693 RepID=A0A923HTI2_9FIRM|nr:phosphomethylpyrimidine synthase ThiC [Acetobacterium paludosum]MBC3888359.1 phosphomethylpyrimidine synthase ThiC [Acetobacterium paludosum]